MVCCLSLSVFYLLFVFDIYSSNNYYSFYIECSFKKDEKLMQTQCLSSHGFCREVCDA